MVVFLRISRHLVSVSSCCFPLVGIDSDDDLAKWLLVLVLLYEEGTRVAVNVTSSPNDF